MGKSSRPKFSSEKGASLLVVLMVVMLISIGSAVMLFLREESIKMTLMGQRTTTTLSLAKSGVDTFLLAWKAIEADYFTQMSGCGVANGLISAMAMGNGCVGRTVTVLRAGTVDSLAGTATYNYRAGSPGCTISPGTSNCSTYNQVFLEMGVALPSQTSELGRYRFEFSLLHVLPGSHVAEFRLTLTGPDGSIARYDFVLQDVAQSVVHLEGSGRLTLEKADPFSLCPASAWGDFRVWNVGLQNCDNFDNPASGTGLASYKGRYFGFRPESGQVVDLLAAESGGAPSSYMVAPNGTVSGLGQVFVRYPDPTDPVFTLANADDIALIDQQIYYVRGGPGDVDLRMVNFISGAWIDTKLCDLGALGWSQSVAGLASMAWNDPIQREPGNPLSDAMLNRSSVFFLKTDAGDLISVRIQSPAAGVYNCQVYMDPSMQVPEYSRTLGFEGSSTLAKYFIY